MRWTERQLDAIAARNESMLVSAAAGSGKTAVLVEKALSFLREGRDVDRLLIVTFTRAAASEMRARLALALEAESAEDECMRRQLMRLPRACIATLHVFCSQVIREHFQSAGIDPMAKIGEESRLRALSERALEEALENAYLRAETDAPARALTAQYTDLEIMTMARALYRFLMARAEPFAWLASAVQSCDIDGFLEILRGECATRLEGADCLRAECARLMDLPGAPRRYEATAIADGLLIRTLIRCLRAGETPEAPRFGRLTTKRAPEDEDAELAARFKELRSEMKDRVRDAVALLPADEAVARADVAYTLPALAGLAALVRDMADRYAKYKDARNLLDFSDLEQLALRALSDDGVRDAVAKRFDVIFVDEYQDISGAQEAILSRVHKDNLLFMVGDVKQSIYRFRLADPTLFLRKQREFSPDADARARKLSLQSNFRSRPNILEAVNLVFAHAMRKNVTEIDYDEEAALKPGREGDFGGAVNLRVVLTGKENAEAGYLGEAREAAEIIKSLRGQYRYRDMAILLRNASGRAPRIAALLSDEGIPVYSDADAEFYDLPEITDMLSLLRTLDNPLSDVPLLCALRSPALGFSSEDLARVRLSVRDARAPFYQALAETASQQSELGERARDAIARIDNWRFLAEHMPPEALLYRLVEETGLYARAGALRGGEERRANLRLLCERAQGKLSLQDFLRDVDEARKVDDGRSAKTLSESEDVVRVMTLHKSKGLEFPVVLLMELGRAFRMPTAGELLQCADDGLALKYIDPEKRITRQTVACRAMQLLSERALRAEEARLLYVGMTRAREALYLLANAESADACRARFSLPRGDFSAGSAQSMLDWIGQSVQEYVRCGEDARFRAGNGSLWDVRFCEQRTQGAQALRAARALPSADGDIADVVDARLRGREDTGGGFRKTSVTALVRALDTQEEETAGDKRRAYHLDKPLANCPAFMQAETALTAAGRGEATHKALCALSLSGLSDCADIAMEVDAQLSALAERGLLSPAEREAVSVRDISRYLRSPVGARMMRAEIVRREWAFNLLASPELLVQGVIDCCFAENGRWVLVDYKTDNMPAGELPERYAAQIRWYARALSQITGRPVSQAFLFSLRHGEAVEIALSED